MGSLEFFKSALTPTIDTSAYADNDVIGGLLTFDLSADLSVNGGWLSNVWLADIDNEGAALRLFLFDALPSTIADQAAFAPTEDDIKKLLRVVTFSTYTTVNSEKFASEDFSPPVTFQTSTGKLYGYLVANGSTPTYAALKLTITLRGFSE